MERERERKGEGEANCAGEAVRCAYVRCVRRIGRRKKKEEREAERGGAGGRETEIRVDRSGKDFGKDYDERGEREDRGESKRGG